MSITRKSYIDVAKGLLILMVVYGHIYGNASSMVDFTTVEVIHQSCSLFIPFYMPCFFVLTGFCSSFNKPFIHFLLKSLKTIILPGVILSFLLLLTNLNHDSVINWAKNIVLYGGDYWFLSSLFLARIIYWFIDNYVKRIRYKTLLCVSSFVLGYSLSILYSGVEYWWFIHALLLLPYLGFGQLLKVYKLKSSIIYSLIYIAFLVMTALLAHYSIFRIDYYYHVPGISQKLLNVNYTMLASLIALSFSGSLLLISISKRINTSTVLEFLGKNSLVIYCVHGTILQIAIRRVGGAFLQFNNSEISCAMSILIAFIVTIAINCLIAYVLNQKYIKILIGKF